jgi:hypothetical protein
MNCCSVFTQIAKKWEEPTVRVQAKEHMFCRKCGKRYTFRDSAIKRVDADEYVEWAIRNYQLCPECYQKHAMQAAIKRASKYNLPKVVGGTEKQVSLAIMLRDWYITSNIDLLQQVSKYISKLGITAIRESSKGHKALETMCSIFTEANPATIIGLLQ